MMKTLIFLGLLLSSVHVLPAADPKYPVNAIPEALKANVDAVFREDISVFSILAKNKASHYVRQVITILHPRAKRYASEAVFYDKLRKVRYINALVYDSNGNVIKKLKNNEIEDQSAVGDGLFSDDRYKYFDLSQSTYPYTVEFEYEIDYKYLFAIPSFYLLGDEKISAEKSVYTLRFQKDLAPRYKALNTDIQPKALIDKDGLQTLTWEYTNTLPIKLEPAGPSFLDNIPYIIAAPSQFEYEGYFGTMNTWDEYGKWISSLNAGRNMLPEPTKEKVRQLTANLKTREEKVRVLYEYLQSKTRYVSIQLGIGGLQPFEASVVDNTGYGDCKALSNYMMALLSTAGVQSNYVLINSGRDAYPMREDFPSTQFDHVLVAVPNEKDTIWLECTSQNVPLGYQGFHTGDRKALMITDGGAKIVSTTHYLPEHNLQSRTAKVTIAETGDGSAQVKTTYAGLQYESDNVDSHLNNQKDEQRKWVELNTNIPTFDILSFSFQGNKNKIPSAVVSLDLGLRKYATVSGKRMFLQPNLMNRSTYMPEKVENRKSKVVRRFSYLDLDTIQFKVPENIYPEFLPEPVKIKSRFGEYEASFKFDQGSLIYTRRMKMLKGEFPPESYQEYIDFYRSVNKADNTKIVFLNKT